MATATPTNKDVAIKESARMLWSFNQLYLGKIESGVLGGRDLFDEATGTFRTSPTSPKAMLIKKLFTGENDDKLTAGGSGTTYQLLYGPNQTYIANSPATGSLDNVMASMATVADVNVYGIASASAKTFLDSLVAWHSLLDVQNWKDFVGGKPVTLRKAEITSANVNTTIADVTNGAPPTILTELIPSEEIALMIERTITPFALRRIFYLYIRLASFQISMNAYAAGGANQENNRLLALQQYFLLVQASFKISEEIQQRVSLGVNRRIDRYNRYLTGINTLSADYDDTRTDLKNNYQRTDAEQKIDRYANILTVLGLVMLIAVVIIVIVAYSMDAPLKQKAMIAGTGVGVTVVVGFILSVLFTKNVTEGFTSAADAESMEEGFEVGFYAQIQDLKTATDTATKYREVIASAAQVYLFTTHNLLLNLQTYRSFGNSTYSMSREYRYFTDHNETLRNQSNKYHAAYRSSDLYQKESGATLYLCIVLSLIVSLGTVAYIAAVERVPAMAGWILWIGVALTIVALVLYVLERTAFVRTDGDKKYWGQPSEGALSLA